MKKATNTSGHGYLGLWYSFFVNLDVVRVADIASCRTCSDVGLYRKPVRIIVATTRDASDAGSLFERPAYRSAAIVTELVA